MERIKWKYVQGYDERYMVSSTGIIKSMNYNRTGVEKIMSPNLDKDGYRKILLYFNGKRRTHRVCRLVATAFKDNPENKPCVNHKNGVKQDDRAVNLEWSTYKENTQHASRNGLLNGGEEKWSSNLTEQDVLKIHEECKNDIITQGELSEKYGVCRSTINHIANKKRWKHLW